MVLNHPLLFKGFFECMNKICRTRDNLNLERMSTFTESLIVLSHVKENIKVDFLTKGGKSRLF